jgi:hypothetical protein
MNSPPLGYLAVGHALCYETDRCPVSERVSAVSRCVGPGVGRRPLMI